MLILPIREHGRSFHFLISSSILFFKDLKFLSYRSLYSLVGVTPRYLVLLVTVVKSDSFLIYFSVSLPSLYRRVTDFFLSYLASCHITTLLKVFISCRSSLVKNFWGHLCILSYHQQIVKVWLLPFNSYPLDDLLFSYWSI